MVMPMNAWIAAALTLAAQGPPPTSEIPSDGRFHVLDAAQLATSVQKSTIRVRAVDSKGSPVMGAAVKFVELKEGRALASSTTDSEGRAEMRAEWSSPAWTAIEARSPSHGIVTIKSPEG